MKPIIFEIALPWFRPWEGEEIARHLRSELYRMTRKSKNGEELYSLSAESLPATVETALLAVLFKTVGGITPTNYSLLQVEENSYRLAYRPQGTFPPTESDVQVRVARALASDKPLELTYGAATDAGRVVWPVSSHEWGFRATTRKGRRSYSWDRVTQVVSNFSAAEFYAPVLTVIVRKLVTKTYWINCLASS